VDGAPLTRTPPRQSWGRGPSPLGVAANPGPSVDVSFTASCAAPTGRVPGLRGAFIIASTPCSCVGVGDQHSGIVRLSESSRQCSLPYLLTYLPKQVCKGAPPPPRNSRVQTPIVRPPPAFFSSAPPRRRAPCAPRAPEWGALPADEGRACHAFFLFLFCFFAWAPPNGAQTLTTTTALSGWALGRGCLLPAGGENRGRGATTGRGTTRTRARGEAPAF